MKATRPTRGQLLALAAAFFYSFQNLAMRAAGPAVDPFVVVLFAGTPTAILSLFIALGSRERRGRLVSLGRDPAGRRLLAGLAMLGLVVYAVGNPLFVKALAVGGAVVAVPAGNTVTIWSALLAALFLREKVGYVAAVGAGLFAAGVIVLSWGQNAGIPASPGWFWAIPLGTAAGFCWAAGNTGTRYAHSRQVDTFSMLAIFGAAGLGAILITVLIKGTLVDLVRAVPRSAGGLRTLTLLTLAGLFNLGAQVTLTLAYLYETVARASVISSSAVAIAAVLAWFLLGETLNLVMLAGILTAFAGAALVQSPTTKTLPATSPATTPLPGDSQSVSRP